MTATFKPTQWIDQRPNVFRSASCSITVNQTTSEEPHKYAINHNGFVYSQDGKWYREPQPSMRSEEFLKMCRFDSLEKALLTASTLNPNGSYLQGVLSWNDKQDEEKVIQKSD